MIFRVPLSLEIGEGYSIAFSRPILEMPEDCFCRDHGN
jgi:hypothetical protein